MRALGSLLVSLSLLLVAATAAAQPLDPQLKSAARNLGAEGMLLFQQGKYEEALDRFERAYKILPAPTLGVRAARSMVEVGRLVEAAERYLEVTRYKLQDGDPWVYRQSMLEAQKERDELLPRIPTLEITVRGPRGEGVTVELDGRAIPEELVGAPQPVDPGHHRIVVARRDVQLEEEIDLSEGGSSRIDIELPPLPAPEPEPPPPAPEPAIDYQLWTWVAFGIGAGGAVASIANGAAAVAQESKLEARCPNRVCPPDAHGAADVYDATRYATTVGLVIGIAGGAAGGALLLFAPAEHDEVALTPGGLRWRGRF